MRCEEIGLKRQTLGRLKLTGEVSVLLATTAWAKVVQVTDGAAPQVCAV